MYNNERGQKQNYLYVINVHLSTSKWHLFCSVMFMYRHCAIGRYKYVFVWLTIQRIWHINGKYSKGVLFKGFYLILFKGIIYIYITRDLNKVRVKNLIFSVDLNHLLFKNRDLISKNFLACSVNKQTLLTLSKANANQELKTFMSAI